MKIHQRGFTLVELSIVLVIIGLLVGGVLTGQSLIRAAELRSVTSQYQRYQAAVMTFRDKYFALPGDMTNAVAYWGAADGSTGTTTACATTVGTGTATCNGDGSGSISSVPTYSNEQYRFWQHLANAGLIEGNYSGISQGSTAYSTNAVNAPSGRISGSLWHVQSWGTLSGTVYAYDGVYNNTYEFGGFATNADPQTPVLKPEDAYNIDTKLDDGKPATGKVVARINTLSWTTQKCTDSTDSVTLTSNYLLTNSSLSCALMFRQQF